MTSSQPFSKGEGQERGLHIETTLNYNQAKVLSFGELVPTLREDLGEVEICIGIKANIKKGPY